VSRCLAPLVMALTVVALSQLHVVADARGITDHAPHLPKGSFQVAPSLGTLRASLPSGATDVTLQELILSGQPFIYASYTVPSTLLHDQSFYFTDHPREFHDLYQWTDGWRKVFNWYVWAAIFRPDASGPLVSDQPVPETANIVGSLHIAHCSGRLGDLVLIDMSYFFGPTNVATHPGQTVALLRWDGSQFISLWSNEFGTVGANSYCSGNDTITLVLPAYNWDVCCPSLAEQDLLCCPSLNEYVRLGPNPGNAATLRIEQRCTIERGGNCLRQ
jgi:hypothetical protein